jgi:hypothetical protein
MLVLNYLIDNKYVIYGVYTSTACFISYLVIKSYSTVTPNSIPTYNLTHAQTQELQQIMDSGQTTPTNSVTQGQIHEILGSGQTTPTNSVTHGQIQELNEGLGTPERITSPFLMTQEEIVEMKQKLERGERLDDFDKVNLEQSYLNLLKFEEYADNLDEIISTHKQNLLEINRII